MVIYSLWGSENKDDLLNFCKLILKSNLLNGSLLNGRKNIFIQQNVLRDKYMACERITSTE